MAIPQSLAIINFMNTLDNFFASMRLNIDNQDPNSMIQVLNLLRCQNYGKNIDVFTNGVIFGVQVCQIKQIGETWGLGYGPSGPSSSLLSNENLNDWVVTRGNIFDGTNIINIEPSEGHAYVYKLAPYITDQMQNYLIPGIVLYSTTNNTFKTVLSGQTTINHPVIAVEKTGINKEQTIQNALNYKYFNDDFRLSTTNTEIEICRFIIDVNSANDYEIHVLNHRALYPFIYGQPRSTFMVFAQKIYNNIYNAIVDGYDSNLVYSMMYYIVNADIWGSGTNAFYTYWTTGGRILPTNVKYYYNILFTPPIL